MAALCAAVKALLDHAVGEARAHVQGESLKARAALHVRLSNSPITRAGRMPHKGQLTGMRGVYLVAAKLSENGIIVSPTSRSARGADLLATDPDCKKAFSVQVKTNATTFRFFLVGEHAAKAASESHIFVLVNLRPQGIEYFVVPSMQLAPLIKPPSNKTGGQFWAVYVRDIENFRDQWAAFNALA